MALAALVLTPAAAGAETRQFVNTDQLYPNGGGGTFGPSVKYPSSIVVSGLSGTVTNVTVTVFLGGSASPDDIDMAIVGPNGQQVMLMSDACGENPNSMSVDTFTFDDSAPTFVSNNGLCLSSLTASYRPSNYLGSAPEPDDLSVSGGPAGTFLNALSFLAGGSPNGAWKLFVLDDNNSYVGFEIQGWALTLDIEQPAGGSGDATAPDTQITAGPKKKTKKRKASFGFSSSEPGATFQCSLDGAAFAACSSPHELKVDKGKHSFAVRAVDAAGNADPTPAGQSWKVKKR